MHAGKNGSEKHLQTSFGRNTGGVNKPDPSAGKKKRELSGDWPPGNQKPQFFDPKQILKGLKETSLEKTRGAVVNDDKTGGYSSMKDQDSRVHNKSRTIKDNKSKGSAVSDQVLSDFVHNLNGQLSLAVNQLDLLKREAMNPNVKMDKSEFVQKVREVYSFTESLMAEDTPSQMRKVCQKLLDEIRETFDVVVDSILGNEAEKHIVQDKCVVADYREIMNQDPDQAEFLELVKDYAKSRLKDWPKSEFKLEEFFGFCDYKRSIVYKPSFDYEKQKLTKTYVDLLQKQFIFDEVLKIIEEEGIDIENLFLAAFERLGEAAQREEESMAAESQATSELTESRKDSNEGSHLSDQLLGDFNIQPAESQLEPNSKLKLNFSQLKDKGETPGFHEEFMENLDNFSLSWRLQAMKEMERGKRRPRDSQSDLSDK